jgi:hypothetical protein
VDAMKAAPITQKTVNALAATGKMVNFIKELDPVKRLDLLSNPELFRGFLNSAFSVNDHAAQVETHLLQQVPGNGEQQ